MISDHDEESSARSLSDDDDLSPGDLVKPAGLRPGFLSLGVNN
jgi:hypothetical protein